MIRALVLLLLTVPTAMADLLPQGHKFIPHEVRFEGLQRIPDKVFVVRIGTFLFIVQDGPVSEELVYRWRFAGLPTLTARLFAIEGGLPDFGPDDRSSSYGYDPQTGRLIPPPVSSFEQRIDAFFANPLLPRSEPLPPIQSVVKSDDPVSRMRTVYTLESLEGSMIRLRKTEQAYDHSGRDLANPSDENVSEHSTDTLPLLGLGVLALCGLGVIALRRRV